MDLPGAIGHGDSKQSVEVKLKAAELLSAELQQLHDVNQSYVTKAGSLGSKTVNDIKPSLNETPHVKPSVFSKPSSNMQEKLELQKDYDSLGDVLSSFKKEVNVVFQNSEPPKSKLPKAPYNISETSLSSSTSLQNPSESSTPRSSKPHYKIEQNIYLVLVL